MTFNHPPYASYYDARKRKYVDVIYAEKEKEMKVTNEQALSDVICGLYCPACDLSRTKPEDWHCPHGETHVSKYASDLLEARAQNAELLAALKEIEKGDMLAGDAYNCKTIITNFARAAIAKMEDDK